MVSYFGDFPEDATVYIPFNTFSSDDPSASVTITNLADADIKVHKDGGLTQIATDGATVAIDYDSITGNHLITIDTSAHADYSTGSEYQVRIEGTTVDGATINAFVGCFSIERSGGVLALIKAGNLSANVVQIDGDTGPADNLGRIAGDTGTGSYLYKEVDTGGIADAVWGKDIRALTAFAFDTGIWGSNYAGGRQLTSFAFDTGVRDTVWKTSASSYDSDTGRLAYTAANANAKRVAGDTGAAKHLAQFADHYDTGVIDDTGRMANAVLDALRADHVGAGTFGGDIAGDTGLRQYIDRTDTGLRAYIDDADTGIRALITDTDTGVMSRLDKIKAAADTGVGVNIQAVNNIELQGTGDTGIADTWRPA